MKKLLTTTILGTALLAASTGISQAETKKTTEIETLIGYNVTDSQVPAKKGFFMKADTNKDGFLDLDEFEDRAMLENEYDVFISMDKNKDKLLTPQEYGSYNHTKPQTTIQHGSRQNWNLTSETKFVPVEPVITDIKKID